MREVGRAEHASTEQLSALLDGRAEPDELVFLAGHVEQCITCSHELADLRAVRDLLRALPVYLPPRSFTIPVEAPRLTRRFGLLIPLTRVMGTIAAVLCVVLFSVDAMQTGYEAPAAVPDSSAGTMHFTTTRSTMDSDRAEDAAAKITDAPAAPAAPAAAAKPAAAFAPAATQRPFSTPIQSIANTVTATPPGLAAESARSQAEGIAAAPPPPQQPQPAAAQAQPAAAGQAQPAAAVQQQPAAAQAKPAAPAPAQPASAQRAPEGAAKPPAPAEPPAPQPTSAAFAPGPPAPTVAPAQAAGVAPRPAQAQQPATPTTVASPWLSPIRLWSLAFALIAAALLIASLVLSRISRTRRGPSDEWSRS